MKSSVLDAPGFAWRILLVAAVIALFASSIQIFYVYPLFVEGLVHNAEDEAIRVTRHISGALLPQDRPIGRDSIDREFSREVEDVVRSFQIWKLKIFSPSGEVLFSTDPEDLGTMNTKPYFHNKVGQGQVFTKTVMKQKLTMEGQVAPMDVVETYVPIMKRDEFLGACEIYYDITDHKSRTDTLIARSTAFTAGIAIVLLAVVAFVSWKAESMVLEQGRLKERLTQSERLSAMGTLVEGVAKEFHRINVSIMGFAKIALHHKDLDSEVLECLESIHRNTYRVRGITTNLLDFARRPRRAPAWKNLADIVGDALSLAGGQISRDGVTLETHLDQVPERFFDTDLMTQAILNIIDNALHAMGGKTRKVLTIETGVDGNSHFLRISDTGHGLTEENLSQVFTPFFSFSGERASDALQPEAQGIGLGLTISRSIVRNHGGRISIQSRRDEGTTVTITLPSPRETGGADTYPRADQRESS